MIVKTIKKQLKSAPLFITALLLFAGVGNLPSVYFDLLRIIVSAVSIYVIFLAFCSRKKLLILPFIAAAVLFNPIHSLSFSRNVWQIIDIICGVLFLF